MEKVQMVELEFNLQSQELHNGMQEAVVQVRMEIQEILMVV